MRVNFCNFHTKFSFSTVARIQFRLPNGVSQNHKFSPEDTIEDLYKYVANEMTTPYGSGVSLSTTFPSRELDNESRSTTLREAGLVPSTTILILPKNRAVMSSNGSGTIMDYIWLLLTPITVIWNMISSFIFGQPATSSNNSNVGNVTTNQPRPSTSGARQRGST